MQHFASVCGPRMSSLEVGRSSVLLNFGRTIWRIRFGNIMLFGWSLANLWCYSVLFFFNVRRCTLKLFTLISGTTLVHYFFCIYFCIRSLTLNLAYVKVAVKRSLNVTMLCRAVGLHAAGLLNICLPHVSSEFNHQSHCTDAALRGSGCHYLQHTNY